HGFSGLGRIAQRAHDRAVVGSSVKRLLDCNDFGVDRCLTQELHHLIERFVWVVYDDILFTYGREAIAAMLADALRKAWIVGRIFQVVARNGDNLRNLAERQRTLDDADAVACNPKLSRHEFTQAFRHAAVEFDADDRTAPTALQRGLKQTHQIFGFFLDLDVAVADDLEGARTLDLVTGEQTSDIETDHILKRNEPNAGLAIRQADI